MKRALVIQLARFGDLVQTKRLLLSLAQSGAEVHLVVDRSLSSLAAIVYPGAVIHCLSAHGSAGAADVYSSARRLLARLSSIKFDRVYNLNFSGLNFSLAAFFPEELVRGYRYSSGQHLVDPWPALAMRWARQRRSFGLNLMDFWAGYAPEMVAPSQVNPPAKARGQTMGVVMAGRNLRRSLPVTHLAPLVQALAAKHKSKRIVLLGSENEQEIARRLYSELPRSLSPITENLVGKTDWAGLVKEVQHLGFLVTPDTGTMHLAAHLGVPVVGYFLSSAWCFETGPYGEGHQVYQAVVDCAPCLETQACRRETICRKPFGERELLRAIVHDDYEALADRGVVRYQSALDELGVDFKGYDASAGQRIQFRKLVAEQLGQRKDVDGIHRSTVEALCRERDWIFHRSRPD